MKCHKDFEKNIYDMLLIILYRFSSIFKEKGITFDKPAIEVWKSSPDNYESEFRVTFYQNEKFIDVIECHIFRGGNKLAELEEFESWFEQAILDLLNNVG